MLNMSAPAQMFAITNPDNVAAAGSNSSLNSGGGAGTSRAANGAGFNESMKKRERTTNWAYEEKRMLLELCKRDVTVIENKRLDADLTALKNRAWKLIHVAFCRSFGTERNVNRLKEQWRRMKAHTRAEVCDYQHRLNTCGPEVADRKRPSPFTYEIWDFMQDAKRLCRGDNMEGVDYTRVRLAMEEMLGSDADALTDEEESKSLPS